MPFWNAALVNVVKRADIGTPIVVVVRLIHKIRRDRSGLTLLCWTKMMVKLILVLQTLSNGCTISWLRTRRNHSSPGLRCGKLLQVMSPLHLLSFPSIVTGTRSRGLPSRVYFLRYPKRHLVVWLQVHSAPRHDATP